MALTYTHFLGTSGLMGTELDAGVTVMIRTESGGWIRWQSAGWMSRGTGLQQQHPHKKAGSDSLC